MSQTEARDEYILKGAMLFVTWPEEAFRPTGDLDLLGHGDADPGTITELFTRICRVEMPADAILFEPSTLKVEAVREEEKYKGVRLTLRGHLGRVIIPVKVDIGFDYRVYPAPSARASSSLLPDLPAADVLMHPPETVLAGKFEAMLRFGEANGRARDFHDIWVITRTFPFDLSTLVEAIAGTLQRRETAVPTGMPVALTPQFAERADRQALWTGFLRRNPPTLPPPPFDEILTELRRFLPRGNSRLSHCRRAQAVVGALTAGTGNKCDRVRAG
ncbi:MAG: nucleotidyl transferase AbiEii/AbiGii toxin family protein [Alphaproteobacteria bacterium]|nr:nucleotidyl transferase AbiEii/AbiGii toxin family protein [Alphaproteobacteria bacterium]